MTPADVLEGRARWALVQGDCLDALRAMPDASVDALVTDPPAGIGFMGKAWDGDKGGRAQWVVWLASILTEALRVLKPGAHALVWALPRTQHWTATAIEDAGFEVRDVIAHVFGQGFPKGLDVSKAIAKVGNADDAQKWDGWNVALKPAHESWFLARKPLAGTVAANVIAHGTGAINIAACRIGSSKNVPASPKTAGASSHTVSLAGYAYGSGHDPNVGRWPSNFCLSHSPECREVGTRKVRNTNSTSQEPGALGRMNDDGWSPRTRTRQSHASPDGTETIPDFACAPGCPVAELDAQSGASRSSDHVRHNGSFNSVAKGHDSAHESFGLADSGGASRFFATFKYCGKITSGERGEYPWCDACRAVERAANARACRNCAGPLRSLAHPTVKPQGLMRWLVRLITTPGGVVLDPFAGSGSTGIAALAEGMRFVGCELSDEYASIARERIGSEARGLTWEDARAGQGSIFDMVKDPGPPAQLSIFEKLEKESA